MKKYIPILTILIIIMIFIFMPRKADPEYPTQVYQPQITPIATEIPTASSSGQMVQEKYDSFLVPKDLQ